MNGFQSPNFTQCPNDFFDVMLPDMHEAELKVTLAALRQTFGYHRKQRRISLTTMQELTGLSRQGVLDGATQAEARGTLTRINDGGVTTWVVNTVDQQPAEVVNTVDQTSQHSRPPSIKENSKQKNVNKHAPEKNGRARPEQSALQSLFSELTGLPEPQAHSAKEKRAAAELWYQPVRRMAALANGTALEIMREAVARLRGRVTIASPKSVEKTFTAIVGERHAPARPAARTYIEAD